MVEFPLHSNCHLPFYCVLFLAWDRAQLVMVDKCRRGKAVGLTAILDKLACSFSSKNQNDRLPF